MDESHSDQGEDDEILPNSIYTIIDIQEVDGYRLIYLVNYWNRGKWNKAFGPDDEAWETNKSLKEKLEYEVAPDGTFWMTFEDWLVNFNTMYYCRIFPQTWSQYCIPGEWTSLTSGGAPPREGIQWMPELRNTTDGLSNKNSTVSPNKTKLPTTNFFTNKNSTTLNYKHSDLKSLKEQQTIYKKSISPDKQVTINMKTNTMRNNLNLIDESGEENSLAILQKMKHNDLKSATKSTQVQNLTKKEFKTTVMNQSIQKNTTNIMFKDAGNIVNDDSKNKDLLKRVIITDSEDRWFLNPQYKLEIKAGSKLLISLMQEDEKISGTKYKKCNFMIILTKGRYTRVWDLKDDKLIKKGIESEGKKSSREILVSLDYNEILRKLAEKKKKNMLNKGDKVHVNIIPYLEYYTKYEIEKMGNIRTFKLIKQESSFWLRIFSSEEVFVTELSKPHEKSLEFEWTSQSAGGGRYIKDTSKGKTTENPHWPINPQYLLKFDSNTAMKIILRKTTGHFSNEEARVGMLLTKPNIPDSAQNQGKVHKSKINTTSNMNSGSKNDQIQRVLESTNKILESKKIDYDSITRKLCFNSSEWVVESSYSNHYVASLFMNMNKIDSPVLMIPTLEQPEATFGFKLSVFSNRPVELLSLNDDNSKVLISEWKETNSGGCHLVQDEKRKKEEESYAKKTITYFDNPKFHISFDSKDRISELEFEIVISRSETIWNKKIANSMVNSMVGIYIFKYDKDKWRDSCFNMDKIDFIPKTEVSYKFTDTKVDPKGYIIMPSTYGAGVIGPFVLMINCKEKFNLIEFNPKKIID